MRQSKLALLCVIAASFVTAIGAGASTASAREWLEHHYIESGKDVATGFNTTQVWGQSTGVAATCAGMAGLGSKCGGEGAVAYSPISELGVEGYINNHSTWNSYFNAWSST